jgi:hypothetical protein
MAPGLKIKKESDLKKSCRNREYNIYRDEDADHRSNAATQPATTQQQQHSNTAT